MIVKTDTLDDFLQNLAIAEVLFENAVRVSIVKKPSPQTPNGERCDVFFQACAIVQSKTDAVLQEYPLVLAVKAGVDYCDSNPDATGTENAMKMREELTTAAERRSFRVLPGSVIGF